MTSADAADANRKTVQAYDVYAERYAEITEAERTKTQFVQIDRFITEMKPGGRVLEVASGPGWDADTMQAKGLVVRRTDFSEGFIAVQAKRGKRVERLDLIADALDGPYDGVVALYVMQHIPRERVDGVIGRMAGALAPGGLLLMSFQTGEGERTETGESGDYHIVMWAREAMLALLAGHGLTTEWERRDEDSEENWLTVIARRA